MEKIFLDIFNMSLMASVLIVVVLIARVVLRKAPKWIMFLLWGLVAIRLICPFSFESIFSLLPSAQPVPLDIAMMARPEINSGIPVVNQVVNPIVTEAFSPNPLASANPLQIVIPVLALIWLVGVVGLILYGIVSYVMLYRKVKGAIFVKENIKQCDYIDTPFILGMIKPIIYIPSGMTEEQLIHVVAHENAHIKRRDYLWKPLGFLILSIHWFNPLVWVAYVLLCKDIEIACDEKVIVSQGADSAISYSQALLECSVNRRNIMMCPLAFGEVSVKARIKHVLNYKKPSFWIIIIAVIVCVVIAICFMTNPKTTDSKVADATGAFYVESDVNVENLRVKYPEYFELGSFKGVEVYVWQLAEGSFDCGILSGTNRKKTLEEILGLQPITVDETKTILNELGVNKKDVIVCPIYQLYSSYMYKIDDDYMAYIQDIFEGCYVARQDELVESFHAEENGISEAVGGEDDTGTEIIDTSTTYTEYSSSEPEVNEAELQQEFTRIIEEADFENAYEWKTQADFKENVDVLFKLVDVEDLDFQVYGICSKKYGTMGLAMNDIIDGQSYWNFVYLPWHYSGTSSSKPDFWQENDMYYLELPTDRDGDIVVAKICISNKIYGGNITRRVQEVQYH